AIVRSCPSQWRSRAHLASVVALARRMYDAVARTSRWPARTDPGRRTKTFPMLCLCVPKFRGRLRAVLVCLCAFVSGVRAADLPRSSELLSPEEWQRLDTAVDRGLEYLSTRQRPDGSFEAHELGQPGITSLCVMAFLSRGHVPE